MKLLLWFVIISALNFGVVAPSAIARMAIESPTAKDGGITAPQAHKTGKIGSIDLGGGSMEVGGVKYLYSPSLTRVSRKNVTSGETLNPLSLHANSHIEFLTKKEGAQERITDIWLTGGRQ